MDMPAQTDVIQYRHTAENLDFLKRPGNTKLGPFKRPECVDLSLFIEDIPFLRGIKSVNNIHHYRLAGAVGADDRMNLAFSDFQANAGQSTNLSEKHMDILKLHQNVLFFGFI
jgi:hypothetical protein